MTDIVQPSIPFRMEAYPIARETIIGIGLFNGAMNMALTLCNFKSDKQAADKLDIDTGLLSSRRQGSRPWQVTDMVKVMEYGQNLLPLTWLSHRYGHGLVMLETEAERRERLHLERIKELETANKILVNALNGKVA